MGIVLVFAGANFSLATVAFNLLGLGARIRVSVIRRSPATLGENEEIARTTPCN
jgi:hypothetical protein